MTEARIFIPRNGLKKVLSDSSGQTAATLSAASQELLAGIAGGLRKKLQAEVARLFTFRARGDANLISDLLELSDVAMNIAEIAGAAERPQVGEAARGILAMVDATADAAGPAFKQALIVHVDAVLLLGAEPPPARKDADAMLRQLSDMRRFLGVTD